MTNFTPIELSGFPLEIFQKRYALHDAETWQEACLRVAEHVAAAETGEKIKPCRQLFYDVIAAQYFMPGGRIWYGSGRMKGQLQNCFVIPIADSREGWGDAARNMIIISGTGGGVGINCSPVRPRNAPIMGTGGVATGAVSPMEIMDAAGGVMRAGGGRRAALLFGLNLNHPDIIEFLEKKTNRAELNNSNISVVFNDNPEDFFKKVKEDQDLELFFRGKVFGKVKARELWNKLVEAALKSGEPGILNGYLANKMSNTWYIGPLISTNPCVTKDTWVSTREGPRKVCELIGRPFNADVNGQIHPSSWQGFFYTGKKTIYQLQTKEGYTIKTTRDHKILTEEGWKQLGDLVPGDRVELSNKINESLTAWEGYGTQDQGWLLGELVGDGSFNPECCLGQLGFWGPNASYLAEKAVKIIKEFYKPRADFKGIKPDKNGKILVATRELDSLAIRFIQPKTKEFLATLESETSFNFIRGFLKGFFDADGTVHADSHKGSSVRLTQVSLSKLQAVQRMLLRLGIKSTIYQNRRPEGNRSLPNGHGDYKEYHCQAYHELVISKDSINRFYTYVGFEDPNKQSKLKKIIDNRSREPYKTSFTAVVTQIVELGEEDVFDCTIEDIHAFEANGIIVHNCGEIWLSAYESCCLGSLVLPRFVQNREVNYELLAQVIRVAVRFLDDVLSVNGYPISEIAETCKNMRRVGLGVMGLHDMLLKCGLKYNSDAGVELVDKVMGFIKNTAYQASCELAEEKGSFPLFDADKFLKSGFVKTLKPSLRSMIKEKGIRNCALLTIAPTGTTSLVCAVTSGIEPMFSAATRRRYHEGDELKEEVIIHPLFKEFVLAGRSTRHFQSAHDIPIKDHFETLRVCQRHVDNSISKTINLPQGTSTEFLSDLYMEFLPEVKGVTVYPDKSRDNQPLEALPIEEAIEYINQEKVGAIAQVSCIDGKCDI